MERKIAEVSTPELVAEITTLAGHLNAANARFLTFGSLCSLAPVLAAVPAPRLLGCAAFGMAGAIAHDFNNILTAVSGYATLLKEELPVDDPAQSDV